ncbi:MAG: hypothetical protein RTU30_12960 [Candidatus Thorarchaeota archaeon]
MKGVRLVEVNDWPLLSERVFRVRGKPGRLALAAMTLVTFALLLSFVSLWSIGRITQEMVDVDLLLSSVSAILFFGVFGWGALFLKQAYYKTINQLSFKDPEEKKKFLERDAVYSDTHAAIGIILTYGALIVAMSVWPLFSGFFPLTLELIPYFTVVCICMGLVGLLGVDAVGSIPNLLVLPHELRHDLQINILRPDRCGGAKAIGDFYFVFTVLVAVVGSLTIVIARSLEETMVGYILAFSFMLLALAVFLIPQMSVRTLLKDEKLTRLEEISERVETLSDPKLEHTEEKILVSFIQLQSLIMLYGEIEKLREFPFETGTFQKVVSTAFIPILIEILFIIVG